jgi:hypothetical protein
MKVVISRNKGEREEEAGGEWANRKSKARQWGGSSGGGRKQNKLCEPLLRYQWWHEKQKM